MIRRRGTARKTIIVAVACTAAAVGVLPRADAQQASDVPANQAPPPRLVLNFGTRLNHESNYKLTIPARAVTTFDTTLGLHFNSTTHIQRLSFSLSALGRLSSDGAVAESGLHEPAARLSYSRETKDARLKIDGSYMRRPTSQSIGYTTLPDGSLSPQPIVSSGTVSTASARLGFETGLRAPVGFGLNLEGYNRLYSGTTDPNAYDVRTRSANAVLKLHPSKVVEYDLGLIWSREHDTNALLTRRRSSGAYVGVSRALSPVLSLSGQLGYQRSETDFVATGTSQISKGAYGNLSLTRDTRTGSQGVTYTAARDSIGLRNTLSLDAKTTLRDGAQLSARIGAAARPGHAAQLVGKLRYDGKLPDAKYAVSIDRRVGLNANDVDVAELHVGASYTHSINALSNLALSLDWARVGSAGYGSYPTTKRQTVEVVYSHELAKGWNLNAGVQHRRQESSAGTARSNGAFLSIGRSFTLLP
ncbi:hypothetical protein [Allgaiera indica]|uniref:hypothetical protein n=1 Tax=Allgaiera indica TaxID=765699 RepID=UPI00115FACC7|nr:hypothetical protein [Allgaiera indica]